MAGRPTGFLAADVAGYSALLAANEAGTASALKGHLGVIRPRITRYDGRIVESADDAFVAEFPNALSAARCAEAIQDVMLERNAAITPNRRLQFRMGIHQAEALPDGQHAGGEGTEVATQLKEICGPGGICISAKAYEEIKDRPGVQYEDAGEQNLQNIAEPVRVYRSRTTRFAAETPKPAAAPLQMPKLPQLPKLSQKHWMGAAAAIVLILLLGTGIAWWSFAPYQPAERRAAASAPPAASSTPAASEPAPAEKQMAAVETKPPEPPAPTPAASEPAPESSQPAAVETKPPEPPAPTPSANEPARESSQAAAVETKPPETPAPAAAETEPARDGNQVAALEPKSSAPPAEAPAESKPAPEKTEAPAAPKPDVQAAISPPPATPAPVPQAPVALSPQAEAAIRDLDAKITRDPNDAASISRRGQLYALNNDYPRAKVDFDEVLKLKPEDAQAWNNRCWVNAILGQLTAALKDCDQALKLKPDFTDALDSRGFVMLKIDLPRDAINDYDAALKLDGRKASSLYGRGIAKKRTGNAAGGDADIAQAKSIDPSVADEFTRYGIQ